MRCFEKKIDETGSYLNIPAVETAGYKMIDAVDLIIEHKI